MIRISVNPDGTSKLALDASSPDELALVCGAQVLGMHFKGRPNPNTLDLDFSSLGSDFYHLVTGSKTNDPISKINCEVLATLDFDDVFNFFSRWFFFFFFYSSTKATPPPTCGKE